jgi:hypothetical protein
METINEEAAMWTIIETASGETVLDGTDPVLFDSEAQALAWAAEHVDSDRAREYAIVDMESL